MHLTEEQVLALAPDESSKKAGKDLSAQSKWVSKGINDIALWGECQGSGSKPYQTQIDITSIAFKCSCPSRKFPCKHGLGLLLLHTKHPGIFTDNEPPAWVAEWISKRQVREEKKAEKKEQPVDEAAQQKRQQARDQSVEDGIEELLLWMKDIIRNGILNIPGKEDTFFTGMAKRMVDAKAPGLAGMVKVLGNTNFYKEGWQSVFTDQLLRIYMVISGFKHKHELPNLLAEDIRSTIGFTQSQDMLKEQQGITDTWLVLSKQTTEEDNLTTERNWLFGIQSKRYALVLQFSVRGQGITYPLTAGMVIEAELVFYPSAAPLRAIIKKQANTAPVKSINGLHNWQQVSEAEAAINSVLPFGLERPYIMKQVNLVQYNKQWWLSDKEQRLVQLKDNYKNLYTLLSVSGGQPIDMAVLGKENTYEPLGAWVDGSYIEL